MRQLLLSPTIDILAGEQLKTGATAKRRLQTIGFPRNIFWLQ